MARDLVAAFSPLRSISDASPNSTAPSLVMGVLVAPHALAQRQALRQTWRHATHLHATHLPAASSVPRPPGLLARDPWLGE